MLTLASATGTCNVKKFIHGYELYQFHDSDEPQLLNNFKFLLRGFNDLILPVLIFAELIRDEAEVQSGTKPSCLAKFRAHFQCQKTST